MDFRFDEITITSGFWKDMADKVREVTLDAVYDRFEETGRFEALKCLWKEGMPNRPHIFWDSDVAKWIESAAYVLAKHPDAALEQRVDSLIDDIAAHQWEDGYINSCYTVTDPDKRFTLRGDHELYCIGHYIEAAIAYYFATGKDRFLGVMERCVDCVHRIFLEEGSAAFVTPGHEEIEIALLRLYRLTKKEKYLTLCRFFLDQRGNNTRDARVWGDTTSNYEQSNLPVRRLRSAEGHSVRAMYLYTAMADMAAQIGDEELKTACRELFEDVAERKMYITGGIGSTCVGEAFTVPFDLPDEKAYAETCAAIGLMLFSQKMLELTGERIYADTLERAMYNGMPAGLSLDGTAFFYENPLEVNLRNHRRNSSTPEAEHLPITQRKKVFECSCCPPNVTRILATMERFLFRVKENTCYVDQYVSTDAVFDGRKLQLSTEYPRDGVIRICADGFDRLALRIPGWCPEFSLSVPYTLEDGYAIVENPGELTLCLTMVPTLYEANQEVDACAGKAALMLGPVVYCAEGVDNGNVNLHRLAFAAELNSEVTWAPEFGMNTICVDGWLQEGKGFLYRPVVQRFSPTRIHMIPYCAFANRGESDMLVWLRLR